VTRSEGQRQSRKHEDRLARATGGRRTPASGAFWHHKGDVRSPLWLIEHKFTGRTQVTIKAQVLEKIVGEAIVNGRIPVLGLHLNGRNYVVLDEEDWLDIDRRLRESNGSLDQQ
jgi:hypothetical protein